MVDRSAGQRPNVLRDEVTPNVSSRPLGRIGSPAAASAATDQLGVRGHSWIVTVDGRQHRVRLGGDHWLSNIAGSLTVDGLKIPTGWGVRAALMPWRPRVVEFRIDTAHARLVVRTETLGHRLGRLRDVGFLAAVLSKGLLGDEDAYDNGPSHYYFLSVAGGSIAGAGAKYAKKDHWQEDESLQEINSEPDDEE